MKVQLIGTGCMQTKSNLACSLINDKILIDVPSGTTKILDKMEKSIYDLEILIITHFHGDHYFDIPILLLEKSFFPEKNKGPFYVIGPKGIEKKTKDLFEMAFPSTWERVEDAYEVKFIELNNKDQIIINDVNIQTIEVKHEIPNSQGYIISINDQKCAFTGDCTVCEGVDELLKNSKILISDASWIEGTPAHMGVNDIKQYLEKYPENIIIGTHMKDITKEKALKMDIENFIIPSDGYTIEF